MTALETLIAEVRRLDKEATPGPWKPFDNGPWGGKGAGVAIGGDTEMWPLFDKNTNKGVSNSFLVAHYRTSAVRLAEIVEVMGRALKVIITAEKETGHVCRYSHISRITIAEAEKIAKGEA